MLLFSFDIKDSPTWLFWFCEEIHDMVSDSALSQEESLMPAYNYMNDKQFVCYFVLLKCVIWKVYFINFR